MNNVLIDKAKVLEIIQKNREEHLTIFKESVSAWKKEAMEALHNASVEIEKTGQTDWAAIHKVQGRMPISHEREYDRAIAMLQLEVRDCIELDGETFAELVQDEWHWQGHFLSNASTYSASAASKAGGMGGARR